MELFCETPLDHSGAQPRQRFRKALGCMLGRKGPASLGVIRDGSHTEAKTAQVYTHIEMLAGGTCAPVSVQQGHGGIVVGIPEELPVGNVIRRVPAARI